MKPEWRRFAPLGLYLALLAALAAIVLYIIFRRWDLYIQIALGLVVVGLAIFAILDPERVRLALSGRQARYGSNALVLSLAFLGILVVINYLIFQNPKRWDLTEDKSNTLADETLQTLEKLPQPVEALAFYTEGQGSQDRTPVEDLLRQYEFNANDKFSYQFINPVDDPLAAQSAGITRDATVVLKMGDRQEQVSFPSETELTAALVRLMGEKVTVYFLTGHGEASLEAGDQESYSQVKSALEAKSYTVKELNLQATNEIPADAKAIVIAGPKAPIEQVEVDRIKAFQENGGALVVLGEPPALTEVKDSVDPLSTYLEQSWGVMLKNDVVVDISSQQLLQVVSYQYASHPITERMRMNTVFLSARSVGKQEVEGISATELILSSPQSWSETNLEGLEATLNEGQYPEPDAEDTVGPLPVAVASERSTPKSRLVVIGDSHFAIDANFQYLGNGDLVINSIDWATEQEDLINLTPKETTQRLIVPPKSYAQGLILLGSVFLLPALVLVAGIVVFVQRRKRG